MGHAPPSDQQLTESPADAATTASPPGTLTSLIEEMVQGAVAGAEGWSEGLRSGAVIGRYELIRESGRGGFGVVWEARDRDLGRTVAFKALRVPGEVARERRLLAEAEVAARLSHPNIVTVLDVGRSEHGVYLIQEFLTGQPLSRRLAAGRLPIREALRIAIELARGLAHAHAHGVVHRDLTPRNVQLCEDGQVKLLDLGMASALGRRKPEGGTPAYMAPEQLAGAPEDERTDVYALGVVLHRMLTGAVPAEPGQGGRVPSAPGRLEVPEAAALGPLVEAMLARQPTDRPRDAGEVLRELQGIEAGLPREAADRPSRARVRRAPRARWMAAGATAALALASAAGLPILLWQKTGQRGTREPLVLAASPATLLCTWKMKAWHDLRRAPPGAVVRNGRLGSQREDAAEVYGRAAWVQGSDWNQLFVPLGEPDRDFFAVQAEFFVPPAPDRIAWVRMMVHTDPEGPTESDVRHGRGIAIYQEPGANPAFEWGVLDGLTARKIDYRGSLATALAGHWRTLRIEGSRSRCWLRVFLDGAPLLTAFDECDLSGRFVLLGSSRGHLIPGDVAWSNLTTFEGEPACQ
jgi:hypothetical protein